VWVEEKAGIRVTRFKSSAEQHRQLPTMRLFLELSNLVFGEVCDLFISCGTIVCVAAFLEGAFGGGGRGSRSPGGNGRCAPSPALLEGARAMEGFFGDPLVLLGGQVLHFGRQRAVQLPQALGGKGSEGHPPDSALLRPAFFKRTELASADAFFPQGTRDQRRR